MTKIDHRKELKYLYDASAKKVAIVEVPQMNFLMIDGEGDPNVSQAFKEAIETLFSVSYTLKFMMKKDKEGIDYRVMPLEALWWVDDMSRFSIANKDDWKWTVMIMQPPNINPVLVAEAIYLTGKKKHLPALPRVCFETFAEGKAAQMMHIGPFEEEGSTVEAVHQFIRDNGFKLFGKHHEIYLSDIRKAAPAKWKTIIRQPIKV